jgi:cell division inhibitor SepF
MSFLQRLRDVLGIDERYDEDDYDEESDSELAEPEEAFLEQRSLGSFRNSSSKVIGMPGLGHMEMVLMQPRSFQEIPQAVMALRERKSVVLDLTLMEPEQAQRSADYVAGGAYAIDGHQRQLGACIFLFTPSFVQISSYPGAQASAQLTQPLAQASAVYSAAGQPPAHHPVGSPPMQQPIPTSAMKTRRTEF